MTEKVISVMIDVAQRETQCQKCHKIGNFVTVSQTKNAPCQENVSSQRVRKKGKYGVNSICATKSGAEIPEHQI